MSHSARGPARSLERDRGSSDSVFYRPSNASFLPLPVSRPCSESIAIRCETNY